MTKYASVKFLKKGKPEGNYYTYINPLNNLKEGDIVVVEARDTLSIAEVYLGDISQSKVDEMPFEINKRIVGTINFIENYGVE